MGEDEGVLRTAGDAGVVALSRLRWPHPDANLDLRLPIL